MSLKPSKTVIVNSILAGCCIGIGATAYALIENQYIGTFIFSLGLLTIIQRSFILFTGQAHRIELNQLHRGLVVFMLNGIGTLCIAIFYPYDCYIILDKIAQDKMTVFCLSFLCGMLMYLAVSARNYNQNQNPIYVILPVMAFILCGAEHCVANAFYWWCYPVISLDALWFFTINFIGNWVGARFLSNMEKLRNST